MRKNNAAFLAAVLSIALVFSPMAMAEDLRSNILPKQEISPVTITGNDNVDGTIIDTLGFRSVTFIIATETIADSDATITPSVQACTADNSATCTAVAAGTLIGTIAGATFAATDDNTVKSIGYVLQDKRYVRLVLVPANNTGNAPVAAVCILGHKQYGPAQ